MKFLQPSKAFEIVTSDLMGPIHPVTKKGNKYILVICDHFTKWVEVYAMKTITAAEVAKKLMKTICQHGIMEQILTDQGTNFQAELMKELYELLDVHQTRT